MKRTLARRFVAASFTFGLLISISGATNAYASARHFDGPDEVAACAGRVWVTNSDNSLTEIDEASGAVVRVLNPSTYDFSDPVALGCGSGHLWVVDEQRNAVTEINATSGHLIRVVKSVNDGFDSPNAIAVGGSHVWITNGSLAPTQPTPDGTTGNSVTELNATNGALVRIISSPKDKISIPDAVIILGSNVWVGSTRNTRLVELNASNGSLVWTTNGTGSFYSSPLALTVTGSNFWEANTYAVSEISGTTGARRRTVSVDRGHRIAIREIPSNGSDVWVTNIAGNSVSEINAATGARVRVLGAAAGMLTALQGQGIALSAKDAWVTNLTKGVVVEVDITTGKLVRVIK